MLETEYHSLLRGFCLNYSQQLRMQDVNNGLKTTLAKMLNTPAASNLNKRVFAGFHPSMSFNASSEKRQNGYLILIYNGFLNMSSVVTTLLVDRIHLRTGGEIEYPIYSIEESNREYIYAVENICVNGSEVLTFPLSETKQKYSAALHAAIIDFALAHELAHIVNKDFEEKSSINLKQQTSLQKFITQWDREYLADEVAISLLEPIFQEKPFYLVYAGAILLFELVDTIRRYFSKLENELPNILVSHPTPRSRRAELFRRTMPERYEKILENRPDILKMHERFQQYIAYIHEIAYNIPLEPLKSHDSIQKLIQYSKEFDHDWFFEVNPGDKTYNRIGFEAIRKGIDRGHEYARSLISNLILLHLKIGDYSSGHKAMLLGTALVFYSHKYGSSADYLYYMEIVRDCIPTFHHLMEDVASYLDAAALWQTDKY